MRLNGVKELRLDAGCLHQVFRIIFSFASLTQDIARLLINDCSVCADFTISYLAEGERLNENDSLFWLIKLFN